MNNLAEFSPADFVAVLNQTLEFAYPTVAIVGELSNFRVSKNRWVYFDLKDETASVKFFGTVYNLPGPLEEGMMVRVIGQPRLSPLYGFSVTFQTISPVGEGSLKRASDLLKMKLMAEGLFDETRKRSLPYPPAKIGLITSGQSAAYHDFVKILGKRWSGLEIHLADVQVQGDVAPQQIERALEYFNAHELMDVVVITRGGGSADDLAAFSSELVTRAVASSRIPTMVAIGHEVDISLAELAADMRASTPSNAAELLTPDRAHMLQNISDDRTLLGRYIRQNLIEQGQELQRVSQEYKSAALRVYQRAQTELTAARQLLGALSPEATLKRGYAVVRKNGQVVRLATKLTTGDTLDILLADGSVQAGVQ